MALARAHVVFSGYVQGVGFRYTARMLAARCPVSGWVRNLPDGTVELEVQGEKPEVDSYLERLRSEMKHHIADMDVNWVAPVDGEEEFSVRF